MKGLFGAEEGLVEFLPKTGVLTLPELKNVAKKMIGKEASQITAADLRAAVKAATRKVAGEVLALKEEAAATAKAKPNGSVAYGRIILYHISKN